MAARDNTTDATFSVAPSGEAREYPGLDNCRDRPGPTGSHNIKVGFLYSYDVYLQGSYHNADLIQDYETLNGVQNTPYQVTVEPTDPRWNNALKNGSDFYAQDSWTQKRLTLTGGVRSTMFRNTSEPSRCSRAPSR